MNRDLLPLLRLNQFPLGCLLTFLLVGIILSSINLGWIFHSILVILLLVFLTPIIAWTLLQWWVKRNLVEANCPVCQYQFTGFNHTDCECPNCGEKLQVEAGKFLRFTPPGTIDVEVVDISTPSDNP